MSFCPGQSRRCLSMNRNWRQLCAPSTGSRMIEGLDKLFEAWGQPSLAELRELLENLELGDHGVWHLSGQEALQGPGQRVFRLRFARDGQVRSLIAKRL